MYLCVALFFFFFNDTTTTEIYTLSLHDALPISETVPTDREKTSTRFRLYMCRLRLGASAKPQTEIRSWFLAALRNRGDRKSTRLNSSHTVISYAVFCLKKKKKKKEHKKKQNKRT